MKGKHHHSFINIGVTSIVLIFVMLCLLTFAVLSLVSARADFNLSKKSADRTTEYYQAENEATDILCNVIQCLDRQLETSDPENYLQNIQAELNGTDGISFPDSSHIVYQVPLGKEQLLSVSLHISYTAFEDGTHYQIDSWKAVSTHAWEPDTSLPVLGSEKESDE